MEQFGYTAEDAAKTLKAVLLLQAADASAKVQKLAQSTNLRDLNGDVLAWIGTTKIGERRIGASGGYRLVRDLNYDVWICTIGPVTGYGRTFADAVLACETPNV